MTLSTQLFLRITLTLIGIAALTGVLAALGAVGSYGGQVSGTCAVAFGVVFSAWCARNKFNQPHTRPAELVFAGGLAITLALAVIAIWLPESFRHAQIGETTLVFRLGMSTVCVYAGALVGSTVFAAWAIPTLRFASMAGTSVVGLLLLLALAATWGADGRCLLAMYVIAPTGLAMAISLIGLGHERRPWRWIGFGAAWAMMAWGLGSLSSPNSFWSRLWAVPWYATGWCVVAGATYAMLMVRPPLRAKQEWLRKTTFGLVGLVLAAISTLAFYGHDSEPLSRILVAGAILAACGTLAILVLSRFAQPIEAHNEKVITHVLLACPRCQEKQLAPLGTSPCMRCRALLTAGYTEPHCGHCQASVSDVMGSDCPHCGGRLPLRGVVLPPAWPNC